MIIGITGHRLQKMGGFTIPNPIYNFVAAETERFLVENKPDQIITGMAIGYDQIVAELAIKLQIPFIAAIPFIGQELLWPKDNQRHYHSLLECAKKIEVVNPGGYASWKMQTRNQWIVKHADMMLAAHDGSAGGTANCLNYAREMKKPITIINPQDYNKC